MKTKDNKIDSLFRDKLADLSYEPSFEAGGKMEDFISRRRNRMIYKRLAIAAGIAIVLSSGYLLTRSINTIKHISLADTESTMINGENNAYLSAINPPAPATMLKKNRTDIKIRTAGGKITKESRVASDKVPFMNNETRTPVESAGIKDIKLMDNRTLAVNRGLHINMPLPVADLHESKPEMNRQAPVTIEYISNDKNVKNNKVTDLLTKAKELGKDVNLGEIRDLKDQLFALDFIKTKKDNGNSK